MFAIGTVPGETALLGAAIDAGTKHDLNIGAVTFGAAIVGRMIGYCDGTVNSAIGWCCSTATIDVYIVMQS